MTQLLLPVFPEGSTPISPEVANEKRDGRIFYFHGQLPVFSHAEDDLKSFRMFTSQLTANGNCKQMDIVRAFGVPSITVKRMVKLYREKGPARFYEKKKRSANSPVLTPEVTSKAQSLFGEGADWAEVAECLDIKLDTLGKAVRAGRLVERPVAEKKKNKSGRSAEDAEAAMGTTCTWIVERLIDTEFHFSIQKQ